MSSSDEFDTFFLTLLPQVLRLAQRMSGDRSLAEDISAEAFARAFARWPKVRGLPYRDAWVLRVASNLALDRARRRGSLPLPAGHPMGDPADVAALRVTLVEALRSLPKSQREAVVLRYLADLSEADVAAALGVKPGTVKSHLYRARQSLTSRLGTDPEELGYGTTTA